jgi:dihydroorotase
VALNSEWTAVKDNLLYKCSWSALEGTKFHSKIKQTFMNGNLVHVNGRFNETIKEMKIREQNNQIKEVFAFCSTVEN